jgi:putative ABC transport system ATP-binding protein
VRSKELGFVFQSYNLLPRLNAIENVMLPMMYQRENRLPEAQRYEKAMFALEQVGLAERARHLPKEMSGGQQQRVALPAALIMIPLWCWPMNQPATSTQNPATKSWTCSTICTKKAPQS